MPFVTRESVNPGSAESLFAYPVFPRAATDKGDWTPGKAWPSTHRMDVSLRPGESLTRYWDNHLGFYVDWSEYVAIFGSRKRTGNFHCKAGFHDATPFFYVDGTLKDPVRYSYYERYLWRCPNPECHAFNVPARVNGCGLLTYTPMLTPERMQADGAIAPSNVACVVWPDGVKAVCPARTNEYAEFVYRMACPYIFVDSAVEFDVIRKTGTPGFTPLRFDDDVEVLLSIDGGGTWGSMARLKRVVAGRTRTRVAFGRREWADQCLEVPSAGAATNAPAAQPPSAYGTYDYLVKFRMRASRIPSDIGIGGVTFTSSFHLNMFALPSLQPGKNAVSVDGTLPANGALRVTYRWIEGKDREKSDTQTLRKAPGAYVIDVDARKREDMRMVSVETAME